MLGDEHTSARKQVCMFYHMPLGMYLMFRLCARQALEFLSSHRDTVIIMLKSEADLGSLAAIEEMRLVVNICAHVLPLVPRSEMVSSRSLQFRNLTHVEDRHHLFLGMEECMQLSLI